MSSTVHAAHVNARYSSPKFESGGGGSFPITNGGGSFNHHQQLLQQAVWPQGLIGNLGGSAGTSPPLGYPMSAALSYSQSQQTSSVGTDASRYSTPIVSAPQETWPWDPCEALLSLPTLPVTLKNHPDQSFQCVLVAATSPATKLKDETLTYLNQGQSYEVKLKKIGTAGEYKLFRTIVRVIFHERRLQYMEQDHLRHWRENRPGERILDIDIPLSYGLIDITLHEERLNTVEFVWDASKETGVFIRVNCISTEFTAKKHGGEKGVPFRVQVETYVHHEREIDPKMLLHCASSQVKVFKPKGADRKHKTDRDKLDRRSDTEKEKFQPSYECTVLTEMPVEQAVPYIEQLLHPSEMPKYKPMDYSMSAESKQRRQDLRSAFLPDSSCNQQIMPNGVEQNNGGSQSESGSPEPGSMSNSFALAKQLSRSVGELFFASNPVDAVPNGMQPQFHLPNMPQLNLTEPAVSPLAIHLNGSGVDNITSSASSLSAMYSCPAESTLFETLSVTASSAQVAQWLQANRFTQFVKIFQSYSGSDLLRLTRDDFIEICGLADGIRLNNALQAKRPRPKMTIFVKKEASYDGGSRRGSLNRSQSTPSLPSPATSTTTGFYPSSNNNNNNYGNFSPKSLPSPDTPPAESLPPPLPQLLHQGSPSSQQRHSSQPSDNRVSFSSKRHYATADMMSTDDLDDDNSDTIYLKKAKTRMSETKREVFHALFLEYLTVSDLKAKLGAMCDVAPSRIIYVLLQRGPADINVVVTDSVVENLHDQGQYYMKIEKDEINAEYCRVILKQFAY